MINRYKTDLMSWASRFDAGTDAQGKVTELTNMIVEQQNTDAVLAILKRISSAIESDSSKMEAKQIACAFKDSLIKYLGYVELSNLCNSNLPREDTRTLPELLSELDGLVGLGAVKSQINDLISFQRIQSLRRSHSLFSQKGTLHLAFIGNPGTGKTTVARIVGHIYKQIGLLSKGHFVEVSRTDLIAGYQGQTALKVKKVIERARGGVLFIDEAYSITENDHSDSYGRECLTELTKALEDYRDDLVVIVAGYTEPMEHFFESNPGLRSRFNTFIEFPNYSCSELEEIFLKMCAANDYALSDGAKECAKNIFQKHIEKDGINFANGRFVRNFYEASIMNHARRVIEIATPSHEDLLLITEADIPFSF